MEINQFPLEITGTVPTSCITTLAACPLPLDIISTLGTENDDKTHQQPLISL
jgi:hypothetical protein